MVVQGVKQHSLKCICVPSLLSFVHKQKIIFSKVVPSTKTRIKSKREKNVLLSRTIIAKSYSNGMDSSPSIKKKSRVDWKNKHKKIKNGYLIFLFS